MISLMTATNLRTRGPRLILWLAVLASCHTQVGCTRGRYRRQADREAYYLIQEKSVGTPWAIPDWFTVTPDPQSRFFDPTNPDCPALPPAGPQLNTYQLPPLHGAGFAPDAEPVQVPTGDEMDGADQGPAPDVQSAIPPAGVGEASSVAGATVSYLSPLAPDEAQPGLPEAEDPFRDDIIDATDTRASVRGMQIVAIGQSFWDSIPAQCVSRILDFASVRDEYQLSYGTPPPAELRNTTPRATFDDLFQLALLNSRTYQLEKERLYQAALSLSLERFAYATKFTARGNTVDTTYTHRRLAGTTVNTLDVPSSIGGEKLLATGGTLVGRFANDVLLTFNGPTGFAADVSSELLFELTQGVFQRDILLEPLIQSERDMVYAARRFSRFRKEFFFDTAATYYDILQKYRQIEIEAQNYFAQVRNFQQNLEEVESEISTAPNVTELNQFEQSVLGARSALIARCLQLDDNLDAMKLSFGIPTETPIDVDLAEFEQLTRRDIVEVNREQAQRWVTRLQSIHGRDPASNHADLLTASYSLAERLITWMRERRKVDPTAPESADLYRQRALFRLDAARLETAARRANLQAVVTADPPRQRILVFQRQADMIRSQLLLLQRQGQLATLQGADAHELDRMRRAYLEQVAALDTLQDELDHALESRPDDATIISFIDRATVALAQLDALTDDLDQLLFGQPVHTVDLAQSVARSNALVQFAQTSFAAAEQGLPTIAISADEAMVTALVQRLDLMNERGALADRWRDIKLAADELRSRLDLRASQTIGTRRNRPFDFSLENSNTRLQMAWDLPLNRKRDRNLFRRAQLDYNAELRSLQQFEDTVKLNLRRQLRSLEQARYQYPIAVAQAALAQEQVLSTRLQLILGSPDVRAIDLLLAYNDSREALGAMFDRRIGYLLERARFALELEVMMLDDTGFWPDINDPQYQPQPDYVYPWGAGAAYGDFPSYLKVSRELRQMLNYPPPGAAGARVTGAASGEPTAFPSDTGPVAAPTGSDD